MKIPSLSRIMALLAALVGALVLWHIFRHPLWLITQPVAGAPARPATSEVPSRSAPGSKIDRHYLEAHWPGWLKAPARDPFLQTKPPTPQMQMKQLNNLNRLKLKAIWRQHGVSMAAINQGVYHLGDVIENFKIISIDDGGVGLDNNGQKVILLFGSQAPGSALEIETNLPAPKIVFAPPAEPASALNAALAALKDAGYIPKDAGNAPKP